MDTKWLEDLIALSREGSFARAADARNVTRPAFGRRIRALETWAGAALVDRADTKPLRLTEAGVLLVEHATGLVDGLTDVRRRLRALRTQPAGGGVLRLATGRTLARTLVSDWLAQMARRKRPLHGHAFDVRTGAMDDVARLLEAGEVDLVCCYEHPAISVKLNPHRYRHVTLARDKLVPVSRTGPQGRPVHTLASGPLVAYAPTLSLGALAATQTRSRAGPVVCTCDSADAIFELVVNGVGLAWLPWTMVAASCKAGVLTVLGSRGDEVGFDVRLYRPRARQSALVEAVWAAADT